LINFCKDAIVYNVTFVVEVAIREEYLKTNSKDNNYINFEQFALLILFFFFSLSSLANLHIAFINKALLLIDFEFNYYSLRVASNMLFLKFRITQLYFILLNNSLQILDFSFNFFRNCLI